MHVDRPIGDARILAVGRDDTDTGKDQWSQSGSVSGSNPFEYGAGGGDSTSGTYNESDNYTDDETSASASSDNSQGTFTDDDGGTASATYSDSGTSSDATSTVNYSDSQSASDDNSYDDSGSFDDDESSSAGASDSQSASFSASDDSAYNASGGASGTYTDPNDAGSFEAGSTSDSEHDETDNGDDITQTGKSESGTTDFSVSDSSNATSGDEGSGHYTNGETGDFSGGDGSSDIEKSSQSGSTVTNSTGTVTSGTFGDDSDRIDGDYADGSEEEGSNSSSGDKLDFNSSNYHDSGNFTDSSLSESRGATFTSKHTNVEADGFSESEAGPQEDNSGGDDASVETDSAGGSYTSASGTSTATASGTADEVDGTDYHDDNVTVSNGPSSSASTSLSYSVSIGTHAHVTGSQTQVNGAVTAANQNYTQEGVAILAISTAENDEEEVGDGENASTSSSGSETESSSSHDSGTDDVSGGEDTDTGVDQNSDRDVRSGSDKVTTLFDNQAGVGASVQTDSSSDTSDYFDTGNYTNTNGTDDENDDFDSQDAASRSTSYSLHASAPNDPGTSRISTFSDASSSHDADNGDEELTNGTVDGETDHFDDANTDSQYASYHAVSDQSAVSTPDDFASPTTVYPSLAENDAPLWDGIPEFPDSGDFTPPEYAGGGTVSISSTADATDSYTERGIEFGTTTDVSGSTNTDETFDDTDTSGDAADVWELSLGSYSTTLGAGSFSQTVADSTSDSETDVNAGTDDGGITTDDYDDSGDEIDEHSSSYSFSASAPSGDMSETGQGTDIASDKQAISLAETGDYTTSATEMEPTDDNPDGDAAFDQSLAVSDDLVEWVHDSLIGTEQGEGVSLSGSADYAGNATENAFSDDTVDVDVAAGTDAQSGGYGSETSVLADRGFSETGTDVFPDDAGGNDKLSANYSHENNYTSDEKDVGNYGNSSGGGGPGGTETLTTSDIDSTDEDTVETLSDGRTFSSGDQPQTTANQSGPASVPTSSEQAPTDGGVQQDAPKPLTPYDPEYYTQLYRHTYAENTVWAADAGVERGPNWMQSISEFEKENGNKLLMVQGVGEGIASQGKKALTDPMYVPELVGGSVYMLFRPGKAGLEFVSGMNGKTPLQGGRILGVMMVDGVVTGVIIEGVAVGIAGVRGMRLPIEKPAVLDAPSLNELLEANAARRLAEMQAEAGSNSHFFSRHGAQTTIELQWDRATTGMTPDGVQGNPVNSSRFFSHRAQLNAAQAAQEIFARTGTRVFKFDMTYEIGEGFLRNGAASVRTTNVQAVFRNGKLITLFPWLEQLP